MVDEAVDSDDAVQLAVAIASEPDVVLMDIRMPRTDGIEATAASPPQPGCGSSS